MITNDALTLVDAALHFERGQGARTMRRTCSTRNMIHVQPGTCYFGSRRQVMASVAYRW